jgi:hypothetical protein
VNEPIYYASLERGIRLDPPKLLVMGFPLELTECSARENSRISRGDSNRELKVFRLKVLGVVIDNETRRPI